MTENIIDNSEYKLFDRFIQGDNNAGDILMRRAYPIVKRYVECQAKKYPSLKSNIDDIVNEAFLRAIDNCYRFNKSSKFSTFVIGFARNIISEYKRETDKRIHANIISFEDVTDTETDTYTEYGVNPLTQVIKKEDHFRLKQAIDMLPDNYKDIIQMCIFNGVKIVDAAKYIGIDYEAARSMYRRAIKKLKENYYSATGF